MANMAFDTTLLNFSKFPEEKIDTSGKVTDEKNLKFEDTVTVKASKKYPPVSGMKKAIMGQNYRYEWSTPVNMRVFNISKEKGGFTILSLGGGKQTKSLRLKENKTGKEWVLR